jgi:hypothetical protein
MSALKVCFTIPEVATTYNVPRSTTRRVVDRLGIGHRVGRNRVVYPEDFPQAEAAFRALGYKLPDSRTGQQQPVAAVRDGGSWNP